MVETLTYYGNVLDSLGGPIGFLCGLILGGKFLVLAARLWARWAWEQRR